LFASITPVCRLTPVVGWLPSVILAGSVSLVGCMVGCSPWSVAAWLPLFVVLRCYCQLLGAVSTVGRCRRRCCSFLVVSCHCHLVAGWLVIVSLSFSLRWFAVSLLASWLAVVGWLLAVSLPLCCRQLARQVAVAVAVAAVAAAASLVGCHWLLVGYYCCRWLLLLRLLYCCQVVVAAVGYWLLVAIKPLSLFRRVLVGLLSLVCSVCLASVCFIGCLLLFARLVVGWLLLLLFAIVVCYRLVSLPLVAAIIGWLCYFIIAGLAGLLGYC
jgi:hypothetical protein